MISAKENFNLQTQGFGSKPKYVITNTFKEESLKKRFSPENGKLGCLYPDTFKANGSYIEVERF